MVKKAGISSNKTRSDTYQKGEWMGRSNNQKTSKPVTAPQAESKKEESGIERNKYIYEQVNGWIENADNKVSVSCGIFTGAFGVFTFLAERYIKAPDNPIINECWHKAYQWSFVLSLLAMAVAVFFYAKAVIPNLKSSGKVKATQKKYPLYYGDIRAFNLEEYQKLMAKGTDKDFKDELILESWHNAGICFRKMKWYKKGVITSIVAIGLAAVSFTAHFLMYR